MIPNAKMEAFEKAPPTKAFSKPSIPPWVLAERLSNLFGSIPGNTINDPSLYMKSNNRVKTILFLNSSMLQIFLIVVINFFTELIQFK